MDACAAARLRSAVQQPYNTPFISLIYLMTE
jgi:hypothetical protein